MTRVISIIHTHFLTYAQTHTHTHTRTQVLAVLLEASLLVHDTRDLNLNHTLTKVVRTLTGRMVGSLPART